MSLHTHLQHLLATQRQRLAVEPAALPDALIAIALPLLEALQSHADVDAVDDLLDDRIAASTDRKVLRRLCRSADVRAILESPACDPVLRTACSTLVAALEQPGADLPEPQPAPNGTIATGNVAGQGVAIGDYAQASSVVAQNYYVAPPDPTAEPRRAALLAYLQHTEQSCNVVQLGTIDRTDAAQRPMHLASVYVGLNTTTHIVRNGGGEREARPLTALEALAETDTRRLMLLGAPGSGKSTFINHLTYCLAGALLANLQGDTTQRNAWLAKLPGWTLGPLLPVRVILRDFAAFVANSGVQPGTPKLLLDFLQATLEDLGCIEALVPITQALREGTALLLLDGFDEVVGATVLPCVAESTTSIAQAYAQTPILITCRILDYQAEPCRQIFGFPTQTLADFNDEQVTQFVQAWYGELAASGRRSPPQARVDATALDQALSSRPDLQELAGLPLLATVMALVHTNRGTLPDARALLYYECIEILLLRWRQHQGSDLIARLHLPDFKSDNLLALMAQLGFTAHEQAERSTNDHANKPADLSEQQVIGLLAEGFARYDANRKHALAELVLHALAQGNGLLLQRGPGVYAFPHRIFQEFLAGYHLLRQPNYTRHCLDRAEKAHWHEALLLLVGYQVLAGGEYDKPLGLVRDLIERSPDEQILAGEILDLMGRERLADYDLFGKGGLWRRTHTVLRTLSMNGKAPQAPAVVRDRAGLVAGKLTSYDTIDVALPIFDVRLPLALVGTCWEETAAWRRALLHYWCCIKPSAFWYRTNQPKLQQEYLPYAFHIARYPVTNADYLRFIAVGGYAQQEWWTKNGWLYKERQQWTAPRLWEDSRYNNPTQPVVGVSWYEAAAYCRWLTAQGQAAGWLADREGLRLPTSLEWERVARHTDQRDYPWGEAEPTPEHANYAETKMGRPTPINCFPMGAAECGTQDMAGNILEWLATPYLERQQLEPAPDFTTHDGVLLSGSAFWHEKTELVCAARNRYYPDCRDGNRGLRLVRAHAVHRAARQEVTRRWV